jgi:hypothetical protein
MLHLDDELQHARARRVEITDDTLTAHLEDGRTIACPLVWYPRLLDASEAERANFRLIGPGTGIHWPDLDEDVSVRGMLLGRASPATARASGSADTHAASP